MLCINLKKIHNKKYQLISLIDHDQQKLKKNYSFHEEKSQNDFDKSLIDDSFIINDKRSFREPLENTINNTKNVTIMEKDKKFLNEIKKHPIVSFNHSNDSLIFRQRLNYDLRFKQKNDNINIENEKIMRSSSHHPAEIAIQHDSNDTYSPISPASDFSFESGFYEGSLDSRDSCFTTNMKKIHKNMDTENSNLSQSNLM